MKPRARFRWITHPVHGEAIAMSAPYCEPFVERIKREIPAWQRVWSKDDRLWFFDPAARGAVGAVARAHFEPFWNPSIAPSCPGATPRADDDKGSNWIENKLRAAQRERAEKAERDARERERWAEARRLATEARRQAAEAKREAARAKKRQAAEARRREEEAKRVLAAERQRRAAAADEARRAEQRRREEWARVAAAADERRRKQAEAREDRLRRPTDLPLDFFSRRRVSDDDFRVLRIAPSTSFSAAKAAYRALVARHHTDVGGRLDEIQAVNVAWKRISARFEAAAENTAAR